MPQNWPDRPTEADIRGYVQNGQSVIAAAKNQLATILTKAAEITAGDMDRLALTAAQRQALVDQRTGFQAVYDAIISAGY